MTGMVSSFLCCHKSLIDVLNLIFNVSVCSPIQLRMCWIANVLRIMSFRDSSAISIRGGNFYLSNEKN